MGVEVLGRGVGAFGDSRSVSVFVKCFIDLQLCKSFARLFWGGLG